MKFTHTRIILDIKFMILNVLKYQKQFSSNNAALIYLVSDVHVKVNFTCIYMYIYTIYYGLINYLI